MYFQFVFFLMYMYEYGIFFCFTTYTILTNYILKLQNPSKTDILTFEFAFGYDEGRGLGIRTQLAEDFVSTHLPDTQMTSCDETKVNTNVPTCVLTLH